MHAIRFNYLISPFLPIVVSKLVILNWCRPDLIILRDNSQNGAQHEPIPHEGWSNQHIITYRGQSPHIRGLGRLRFEQTLDNFHSLKLANKSNHKNHQPPTVNLRYIQCDLIVLHVKIVVIN